MTTRSKAQRPGRRRGFRLTVIDSDGTTYGLSVAETNGQPDHTTDVATITARELQRLGDTVQTALRSSKKPPTSVHPARRQPVDIDEAPGVRLVLAALAIEPLRRRDRVREILEGVNAMSDEEAYYWYAKVTHPVSGSRCLRAMRLLLSEDER